MSYISIVTMPSDEGIDTLLEKCGDACFDETLTTEAETLSPYLKALGARLEGLDISGDDLKDFIANEARTKKSLILSTSHIFMSAEQAIDIDVTLNKDQNTLVDLWMGPPMAKHGYGFFRSLSRDDKNIIYPTLTLPNDICGKISAYDTEDFFEALNGVMDIVNHDYAHQMTLPALNDAITGIRTFETPLLESYGDDATKIDDIVGKTTQSAYERWATDSHRLTLAHIFENSAQMDQMKQRVHNAFSELGNLHDRIAETDRSQAGEVYQYFADVMTFNLMRACGQDSPLLDYAFDCIAPEKMTGYFARIAKQTFLSVHKVKLKSGDFSQENVDVLGELKLGKQNRDGIGNMLIQLDPERVLDVMIQTYEDDVLEIHPGQLDVLRSLKGCLEGEGLKSFRREFEYGYIAQSSQALYEEQESFRELFLLRFMRDVFFGDLDDANMTRILSQLEGCRRDSYGYNYSSEFEAFAECNRLPTQEEVSREKQKTFRTTQIVRDFEDDDRADQVATMDRQIIGMLKENADNARELVSA